MNILYLAHRIPFPPNKGDKLRAFHQIEHLGARHRVWCACFVDRPSERRYVEPLGTYCEEVTAIPLNRMAATVRGLAGLTLGGTMTESFYRSGAMEEAIKRWVDKIAFDVTIAFSSSMAPYALAVPSERRVLDLCDLDSRKWLDYAEASSEPAKHFYRTEGMRLAAQERAWLAAFDATLLITQAEAVAMGDVSPRDRLHVVGNGVHLPALQPLGCAETTPVVGFVGAMDYRPNVEAVEWFVSSCWDRIRAVLPQAVFRIVGRSPTRRVSQLGARPGVHVVGEVDDVRSELRKFQVSVAPLQIARGLQNKVLEAMAAARPVVLTSKAAEGITGRSGDEFLVADTPDDMIASVIGLLRNAALRRRIGASARRCVDRHHHWGTELGKFELIITGGADPKILGPKSLPRRDLDVTRTPVHADPKPVTGV